MRSRNTLLVFDLDDTLYKEIDFLKSAFREIGAFLKAKFGLGDLYEEMIGYYEQGYDVFQEIINAYQIPIYKYTLIKKYREHQPDIHLDEDTLLELKKLKNVTGCTLGIITDGRKVSQTNKINALGLKKFVEEESILILEDRNRQKPNEYAFRIMEERHQSSKFIYVGDNPQKDFLAPNRLGWNTVCLMDNGRNIHKQVFDLPMEYLPKQKINTLSELSLI